MSHVLHASTQTWWLPSMPAGLWSRCHAGRGVLAVPSLAGKQARSALGELLAGCTAGALHVIPLVWRQPPDVPAQPAQLLPAALHALNHTAHGMHKPHAILVMTPWPCASSFTAACKHAFMLSLDCPLSQMPCGSQFIHNVCMSCRAS